MAWFEFYVRPSETGVNVLSQGDLTIIGTEGIATTHGNGRYSMMVFLSISMFLSDVRAVLLSERLRDLPVFKFTGIDGSFQAYIVRETPDEIEIKVFGKIISIERNEQFIRELWQTVEPFVSYHRANIDETYWPNLIKDLDRSMRLFAEAFADILYDN